VVSVADQNAGGPGFKILHLSGLATVTKFVNIYHVSDFLKL